MRKFSGPGLRAFQSSEHMSSSGQMKKALSPVRAMRGCRGPSAMLIYIILMCLVNSVKNHENGDNYRNIVRSAISSAMPLDHCKTMGHHRRVHFLQNWHLPGGGFYQCGERSVCSVNSQDVPVIALQGRRMT